MTIPAAEVPTCPTPILDRLLPLPKPAALHSGLSLGLKRGIILGSVLGVVFTFWHPLFLRGLLPRIVTSITRRLPLPGTPARLILFVILLAVLAVVLHELGHLLAGLAMGFRFNSLRIGPLQFNLPFRFSSYRGPGAWSSGAVGLIPAKVDKLAWRALVMVFAGPAANLLSGFAVLVLPFSKGFFSWAFVFISIACGMIELLVPLRSQVSASDARRIWMLLRDPPRGERWLAMLKLAAELQRGVMPESLSAGFLAKAIAVRDGSPDTVSAYAMAYAAAFFRHNDAEAAQALETCLQYSGSVAPVVRESLMSDAAVFQARRRKRIDLAEQWMASIPQTTQRPWLPLRAQAAILEAQGDTQGAVRKLDEVEKAVRALPNQAQREVALRLLRRWQSELWGS